MQVTVDLDVMVRDELLTFLRNDSISRGATIICGPEILSSSALIKYLHRCNAYL